MNEPPHVRFQASLQRYADAHRQIRQRADEIAAELDAARDEQSAPAGREDESAAQTPPAGA